MSRWRAEDFLEPAHFRVQQMDFCDLDLAARSEFAKVSDVEFNGLPREESLTELLAWARRGLIQAKAELHNFCLDPGWLEERGASLDELLRFLREGAASGNAFAMRALANCLYAQVRGDRVFRSDLLVDELLYWYWRASLELDVDSLISLRLFVGRELYGYPTSEENVRERYLLTRLLDLVWIYSGNADDQRQALADLDAFSEANQMTEEQVALAEGRVREWLENNPTAFSDHRKPYGCPDLSWRDGSSAVFRNEALRDALKPYGN